MLSRFCRFVTKFNSNAILQFLCRTIKTIFHMLTSCKWKCECCSTNKLCVIFMGYLLMMYDTSKYKWYWMIKSTQSDRILALKLWRRRLVKRFQRVRHEEVVMYTKHIASIMRNCRQIYSSHSTSFSLSACNIIYEFD